MELRARVLGLTGPDGTLTGQIWRDSPMDMPETGAVTQSAVKVLKSTCRMCHGGCSTLVHVKDRRIVRIEGDPDGPLNRGRLCPMAHASLDLAHSPARPP